MRSLVRKVTPAIHRIRLDSKTGLIVNAWLIEHDYGYALVDTGFPNTVDQLDTALETKGLRVEDLTHILYTHTHVDHIGGGIVLGERVKAVQLAWVQDELLFHDYGGFWDAKPGHIDTLRPQLPADSPHLERGLEELSRIHPSSFKGGQGRGIAQGRLVPVKPGDIFELAPWRFRILRADGHDPSHIVWLDEFSGAAFTGDVVMSVPTPIVRHMGDDLRAWLRTMDRLRREPIKHIFPGHGMPSALIDESFDRSQGYIRTIYSAMDHSFSEHGSIDPLALVAEQSGIGLRRRVPSYAVVMANAFSVMHALQELGVTHTDESQYWRLRDELPTWDEFLERMVGPGGE